MGLGPNQPKHCITFENPCLTLKEREEGLRIIHNKNFETLYTFCFVGRLEDAKGVQRIIDAFVALKSLEKIKAIHFIGNGEKMDQYKKKCEEFGLPVVFHGFLERQEVFEIYQKSHFLMLPSTASEGFPKVIAEAMNFGCIPIVSAVSSIGQYVNAHNGFIINPCTSKELLHILEHLTEIAPSILKTKANKSYKVAKDFTFENYRNRIKSEILK